MALDDFLPSPDPAIPPREVVRILREDQPQAAPWAKVGPHARAVADATLPPTARERALLEAQRVLSRCVPPGREPRQSTGLVVGQVQSGKTANFTLVSAMARDNQIPLVIVLTGTKRNLCNQSEQRLRRDLGIEGGQRQWRHISVGRALRERAEALRLAQEIDAVLSPWRAGSSTLLPRTGCLVTVLKQHNNLDLLIEALESLHLEGIPALVIDDEGDQASLNGKVRKGGRTTTYSRLEALRRALPRSTYLLYTATPQAPLLISILDWLSPSFAVVLAPGEGYTGGRAVFLEGSSDLVRLIQDHDPVTQEDLAEPPASLLEACALFLVSVADALLKGEGGNRSMLVHPHQSLGIHGSFFTWLDSCIRGWLQDIRLPEGAEERIALVDRLWAAYQDLSSTVSGLSPFKEIIQVFPEIEPHLSLKEVNTSQSRTPEVDWKCAYGHILVGANAMDRGFTIEGLTVTYMPRGTGMGNADTIQQRARFFGYKAGYLGHCRVWLAPSIASAFTSYVEHEEHLRATLLEFEQEGSSLRAMRRRMVLDPALQPTRSNVLRPRSFARGSYGRGWTYARNPFLEPGMRVSEPLVTGFLDHMETGHGWAPAMPSFPDPFRQHRVARIPLQEAMDALLLGLELSDREDAEEHTGLLLVLAEHLRLNPDAACTVLWMRPDAWKGARRPRRSVSEEGLTWYLQGASPDGAYPGDAAFVATEEPTIQVHAYDLELPDSTVIPRLHLVATWIPEALHRPWLVQHPEARP